MSEFFNVTINKDIVFDDSTINSKTGWTSDRIHKEIIDNKITKFEELEDVDVTNKKNNQIVSYCKDTGKFTTMDLQNLKEITGVNVKQINKKGIKGSLTNPYAIDIPINSLNFKVIPVSVLKYDTKNKKGITEIKNDFKSSEISQFEKDNKIVFDGKAHMKTEYDYTFKNIKEFKDNKIEYSTDFRKSDYKNIEKFKIYKDGDLQKLKVAAIPQDRLLISNTNIDLSNVESIDYFKLNGKGKNLRIICSIDDGDTWQYFKDEKWEKVDLDIESIREKGMDITTFNSIDSIFWNQLATSSKIRFAYLFSMDNIDDIEEIDNLTLKYDENGSWIQCESDEFKATYVSNGLLKVQIYFSGDVKINYGTGSDLNIYEDHWEKESFKNLNLLVNIKDIFNSNKYYVVSNSEFVIKNNISSINKKIDVQEENQLHLVVTDNNIKVLDVFIPPQDTQKYILGISPNLKIFVKGKFSANFYMTVF